MAKKKRSLKGAFLTGLLALLPLLITVLILKILLGFIQSLVGPVMEILLSQVVPPEIMTTLIRFYVPTFLGVAFVAIMVFVTGLAIQLLFGKALFGMLDTLLGHVPMVSGIYHGVRQITQAFDGSGGGGLRQVVLIRPIRGGTYMLGFLTRKVTVKGKGLLAMVYVPTNTMYTGDTYLVPAGEIVPLDMAVEEGVKLVVSGGLVGPAELPLLAAAGKKNG